MCRPTAPCFIESFRPPDWLGSDRARFAADRLAVAAGPPRDLGRRTLPRTGGVAATRHAGGLRRRRGPPAGRGAGSARARPAPPARARRAATARRPPPVQRRGDPLLRRRLREEDDPEVLRTVISALGYNGAREALPDVLDLAAHPHDWVRFAVAAALPSLVDPAGVEPAAADALLALSADDDAETRYYAFYAILLEVAGMDPTAVGLLATRLGNDPDAYIRSMATAHQAAITRLTARFRADPDEKIRTIATDHPEAIIEVRRLLNVWDYLGIHEVGKDTDEHDRLIGPLLRALADNLDATALQQVLDHQLRSPTDTWTEGLTTSLLGWWRTVR
ncbi:HEAT repeat domain-containing protein [Paractinoplanes durhamensis]|uniref:HEAT repeat domain-containing protein n=1 Tax=Paractinoplanes durhamensis TaxID=113563 RepID=UPI0036288D7C